MAEALGAPTPCDWEFKPATPTLQAQGTYTCRVDGFVSQISAPYGTWFVSGLLEGVFVMASGEGVNKDYAKGTFDLEATQAAVANAIAVLKRHGATGRS